MPDTDYICNAVCPKCGTLCTGIKDHIEETGVSRHGCGVHVWNHGSQFVINDLTEDGLWHAVTDSGREVASGKSIKEIDVVLLRLGFDDDVIYSWGYVPLPCANCKHVKCECGAVVNYSYPERHVTESPKERFTR